MRELSILRDLVILIGVAIPIVAIAHRLRILAWVATSRPNEMRHWLSDLPFGAAIGLMAGRTVTVEVKRWTVAPMVLPAGAGVQVSFGDLPREVVPPARILLLDILTSGCPLSRKCPHQNLTSRNF